MVCFTLQEIAPGIELELDKVRELPSGDASTAFVNGQTLAKSKAR